MNAIVSQKKSLELKKHVGAIHSSNRLTLIQRKVANALLYNAYDNLLDKEEHCIHIANLCELIAYDSNDYKKIKQALVGLISTVIEWNLIDKEQNDKEAIWNASSIISSATIDGPLCYYSYSNKMKQLLYLPEIYGRLNMQVQSRFKSSYGLALYENCIRYQNISQTPWLEISTFRKLMGVEDGLYTIFRDFKRRVVDKAVAEVNEHAPILISTKFKKIGRQVTALQFHIKKSGKNVDSHSESNGVTPISDKLNQNYGLSAVETEHLLKLYPETYILEKMLIIETSISYQNGKIANLAKYLKKALLEDYQPAKSSKDNVLQSHKEKQTLQSKQQRNEEQWNSYKRYLDLEIVKRYHTMTLKQKSQIHREFGEYVQHSIYYDILLKDGLSNILAADRFCDFVRQHRKDLLVGLEDFQNYCEK